MTNQPTQDQATLIRDLHKRTGLSLDECKDVALAAKGDGNELSRLLEEKAELRSQSERLTFGQTLLSISGFLITVISKLIGSILISALLVVPILIVVAALRDEPIVNFLSFFLWACIPFGVLITLVRLFESDFWR